MTPERIAQIEKHAKASTDIKNRLLVECLEEIRRLHGQLHDRAAEKVRKASTKK